MDPVPSSGSSDPGIRSIVQSVRDIGRKKIESAVLFFQSSPVKSESQRILRHVRRETVLPEESVWKHALKANKLKFESEAMYRGTHGDVRDLQDVLQSISNYIFEDLTLPSDKIARGSRTEYMLCLFNDCLAELQQQHPDSSSIRFVVDLMQDYNESYFMISGSFKGILNEIKSKLGFSQLNEIEIIRLFAKKLSGEIRSLNEYNTTLIFDGSISSPDGGHQIIYQIKKEPDDTYSFTILNAGAGIENHEREILNGIPHVFPLTASRLNLDSIADPIFLERLLFQTTDIQKRERAGIHELVAETYSFLYDHLIVQGGGQELRSSGVPYPEQVKGSCTVSSMNMLLAQYLTPSELEALKQIAHKKLLARVQKIQKQLLSPQNYLLARILSKEISALETIRKQPRSKL